MKNDSRKIALDALIDFDRNSSYINHSIQKYLRMVDSSRDKAFVTNLVYGVVENRILLDYYISAVSSVRLRKINIVVLNILRLGLYQILFLSTPPSAACNTSVLLAKSNGQYKSSGFVNAILRKLSDTNNLKSLPDKSTADYYKIKYSLSDDVFNALEKSVSLSGIEEYFQNSKLFKDRYYAAVNTHKISDADLIDKLLSEGINAEKSDLDGLVLINSSFDVQSSDSFNDGYCHIIGYPSFLTAAAVDSSNHETIIDMCCCPGGKTMTLSYLGENNKIFAFDIYENKISTFKERLKKFSLTNIFPIVSDGTVFNPEYENTADAVLCDVPCSCLGMIFKKPDIKLGEIDFDSIIKTQKSILLNASKYLKKGGRLVYSTCTVNPYENINVINEFLKDNSDFTIDYDCVISDGVTGVHQFMPCEYYSEAFFIAVLRKNS